jgi:hypothetical protein
VDTTFSSPPTLSSHIVPIILEFRMATRLILDPTEDNRTMVEWPLVA